MEEAKVSGGRQPNWPKEDELFLTELVKEQRGKLDAKFSPTVSTASKDEAWKVGIRQSRTHTSCIHALAIFVVLLQMLHVNLQHFERASRKFLSCGY
jgi:hypothetical protein